MHQAGQISEGQAFGLPSMPAHVNSSSPCVSARFSALLGVTSRLQQPSAVMLVVYSGASAFSVYDRGTSGLCLRATDRSWSEDR